MTPAQRYLPRVVEMVARAYGMSVDTLLGDEPGPTRHQARRIIYGVASTTLGMSCEHIGRGMQRGRRAVYDQLQVLKREARATPMVAATLRSISARVREEFRVLDVLAAEAAE